MQASRAPEFLRGSLYSGTRRDRVKNLAQSTALVNGLDDVVPDGSTITIGNNTFQASYESGDGNDLTLTVVP